MSMFSSLASGGAIWGGVGSVVAGGALATATLMGVVTSQTSAPDKSPADVSKPAIIDYGSTAG